MPVTERIVLGITWWLECFESVNDVARRSFARNGKYNREYRKHLCISFVAECWY